MQDLPEPSKALVTTRERKLERAWTIPLKGLEEAESLALIRAEGRRIGMPALEQAAEGVLLPLYTATGGAPLALKWAVGQIKQPGQSLETVLAALHAAQGELFAHMFARAWELLTSEARQVLLVMPLFASSATRESLAAVSALPPYRLDQALGELLELSLVEATPDLTAATQRYSVHPLTRAFASLHLPQTPDFERLARARWLDYFHALAGRYRGLWSAAGFAALNPEIANILAVLDYALTEATCERGAELLVNVNGLLISQGYWNEVLTLNERAVTLLRAGAAPLRAAQLQLWPLSWLYRHLNRLEVAEALLDAAEPVFQRHGAARQLAYVQRYRGRIAQERGELTQAERWLRAALRSLTEQHDEREISITVNNLAEIALERGDLAQAEKLCQDRIAELAQYDDPERLAVLHFTLGRAARQRNDLHTARERLMRALALAQQASRLDAAVGCLVALAEVEFVEQQVDQAITLLLQARDIYERLGITEKIAQVNALLSQYRAAVDQNGRQ